MEATSGSPDGQQRQRDVRRVLQVLLPALPPPAIDLALGTVFASTSLNQQGQQQRPHGRFRLRRVDSGQLSTFNVLSPIAKPSQQFCGDLVFNYEKDLPAEVGQSKRP